MNHSEICHLFFSEKRRDTTRTKNIFIHGNAVYSYGFHFQLGIEIEHKGKKYLFVNTRSYSNSTSKHQNHFRRAINSSLYEKVFKFDFLSNYSGSYFEFSQNYFEQLYTKLKGEAQQSLENLLKAKSSFDSFQPYKNALNIWQNLVIHFPDFCHQGELILELEQKHLDKIGKINKAQKVAQEKREQKRERERQIASLKDQEKLPLWLNREFNGQLYNLDKIYLRLSSDGQKIETSKGAKVDLKKALQLHKLLLQGKAIGSYIDGFQVLSVTIDYIKIGCHIIYWEQINEFLSANNLEA